MALNGNRSVLHKSPGRFLSGTVASGDRSNFSKHGMIRGSYQAIDAKAAIPNGYRPHTTWVMAKTTGGLASINRIGGTGTIDSFNLAGGLNAESTIAGVGGISDAAMGLIMSAVASLAGTGSMSGAASALLSAIATLSGTSTMSAPLGAIAGGLATLSGQGGVCCSNLTADAYMSSDIAPATTVAADVIARAVLDVVVENNLTLADVQRLLLAVAAGDATGLDSNPVFKSQDGTTDRITGTLAGGNRTVTGVNP